MSPKVPFLPVQIAKGGVTWGGAPGSSKAMKPGDGKPMNAQIPPEEWDMPPGFPALVQFYGTETRIAGDVQRLIGNFNPRYVGTDIRWMMRLDPDVSFGLALHRAPLVNLEWSIESHDPIIKAFVTQALEACYRELAGGLSLAMPFGRQICEKVWESRPLKLETTDETSGATTSKDFPAAWVYKRFKAIDPRTYHFIIDHDLDDWVGVEQLYMRFGLPPLMPVSRERLAFWCFRREEVFGRLEGFPMLDQAYEPWWFKTATQLIANRYFEHRADPPLKIRAGDRIMIGGKEASGFEYMATQALQLKSGGAVVLPNLMEKETKEYKFDLEYMKDDKRGDQLQQRIDGLSTQILRSLWVTDRAGTSGRGGQASRGGLAEAKQHAETMSESQESIIDEYAEVLQEDIIDPLVLYNFGEEALRSSRTKIVTAGVSDSLQAVYKDLLIELFECEKAQLDGEPIRPWERMDVPAILKTLQIPQRPGDELEQLAGERKKEKAAREAQAGSMTPGPGGADEPLLGDAELEKKVRDRLVAKGAVDHGVGISGQNPVVPASDGGLSRRRNGRGE